MSQQVPTKEELCREVMQLVLQGKINPRHGNLFKLPFLQREYGGEETLDTVRKEEGCCRVCAIGALFYARIHRTPFNKLLNLQHRAVDLARGRRDEDDILPAYGTTLVRWNHLWESYALPFAPEELVAFEDFFEGIRGKMTNATYNTHIVEWSRVQEHRLEPYASEEILLLRVMANFLRNGRLNFKDNTLLGLKELQRIAHNKELHHEPV